MQENLRLKESDRALRIVRSHNPSINPDRSVDVRKNLTEKTPRVKHLPASTSVANGQYTRESSHFVESKLVTYKYLPSQVFRRYHDGKEIPILECINGEWFPLEGIIIKESEFQALKAFPGAYGMDVSATIHRKMKKAIASTGKTVNDRGRVTYKCANSSYEQVEQNLLDADIRRHNAKKLKNALSSVQITNVKRKK